MKLQSSALPTELSAVGLASSGSIRVQQLEHLLRKVVCCFHYVESTNKTSADPDANHGPKDN